MTTKQSLIAALVFCSLTQTASADDAELTKQFSDCMDKAGGVTAAMVSCIGTETQIQDARLNKAYQQVTATLPPVRKKQLQEAQRAWIKYRDANCKFYADPDGGTMATVMSNQCFLTATTDRAKELEGFKD